MKPYVECKNGLIGITAGEDAAGSLSAERRGSRRHRRLQARVIGSMGAVKNSNALSPPAAEGRHIRLTCRHAGKCLVALARIDSRFIGAVSPPDFRWHNRRLSPDSVDIYAPPVPPPH